ncbi:MAG: MATE family efflux transporter [Eubacteriales bacterium]
MNDMTKGNSMKQLLMFMLPVLLGNLFQNLYSMVDTIIVGQYLGVDALAAVGTTGSITFLVIGWVTGMTSGFGILIAQAFGAEDTSRLRHYTAMSIYICVAFTVLMIAGLLCANDALLHFINTPDNIYTETRAYITVIYIGLSATFLYNMLAAIARALGDSKTPLYFLVLSSVLNIILDFWFVGGLDFGVAGAGYATVLSQAVAGFLCLIYVYRRYPELRFSREEARFKFTSFKQLMAMGIPMGLQFSITAIGTMIVQSALNQLGSVHIAAYASAMKIQNILMQFSVAMGAAVANFVGQNYGAGKIDRVKKGVGDAVKITLLYSIVGMVIGYFIAPSLVRLFADDPTGEMEQIAIEIFHITIWFYPFLYLIFIYRNALQGLGNGMIPMLGGIFELIARGLVIMLLFEGLQFVGVCLSDPIAWVSALIPLVPYYYWYRRKITRRMETTN